MAYKATVHEEWRGHVELTVPGEIRIKDTDHRTFETWTRTVACPLCGKTTGLILHAHDAVGLVICPDDDRAFVDYDVHVAAVRQMYVQYSETGVRVPAGEPLQMPGSGDFAWLRLVPVLEEDRTVQPLSEADDDEDDPLDEAARRRNWSITFGGLLTTMEHPTTFTSAMFWARSLLTWAVPNDTTSVFTITTGHEGRRHVRARDSPTVSRSRRGSGVAVVSAASSSDRWLGGTAQCTSTRRLVRA